ncbi:MAG TPA: DUF4321 domain-containing protein [Selenomonadales bacterium]|nr:DUF4321 domain-containing protein [Selenomonadales bacterium]
MKGGNSNFGVLALFLILGAVLGGILGELIAGWSLGGITPFLVKTFPIFDQPPVTINLYIIQLVIGLSLHPNLISLLGVIAAYFVFRRF